MNKELYVSSTPHETKVALVEDDQLAEVFFERENEYTLAGSIYKGRVTRVLPGMQSAFVNIGLERDAFLYVSDFLELPSDEDEDEEFGQIPTPRTTVNVGQSPAIEEPDFGQSDASLVDLDSEEDSETVGEDLIDPGEEQSVAQVSHASPGEDRDSAKGARRWRGRRRRGGRRGRPDERDDRPEPKIEAAKPAGETSVSGAESRPRSDVGPPADYTPILLPGESISKYRTRAPYPAAEPQEARQEYETQVDAAASTEDFAPPVSLQTDSSAAA